MKNKIFPVEVEVSSGGNASTRIQNFLINLIKKLEYFHGKKTHQIQSESSPFMNLYRTDRIVIICLRICSSGNGGALL